MVLLLALARVPEVVAAAVDIEEAPCAADCDNENEQGQCPPNCHLGACCKVFPTLAPAHAPVPAPEVIVQVVSWLPSSLIALLPSGGVFHPPRA